MSTWQPAASIVMAFSLTLLHPGSASAQDNDPDRRAHETERKMTDDERFSMLISVMGTNIVNPVRDKRIPEGVPMSAGYTPGVTRLGVPALMPRILATAR
jgi:hypothetical protein